MSASLDQLVMLARADQQLTRRVSDASAATIGALFDRHVVDLTDASLKNFTDAAAPVVDQLQQTAARNKAEYVGSYVQAAAGELVDTPSIELAAFTNETLRGTASTDVYRRAVITARAAASRGSDLATALGVGKTRATSTARTDTVLSGNAAFRDIASRMPSVVGYRRLPGWDACPFCLAASTQRYHVDQLQPLHNRCTCSQAPIVGTKDPGQIIDRDLHDQLKKSEALNELSLTGAARRSRQQLNTATQRAEAADRDVLDAPSIAARRVRQERADRWRQREAESKAKLARDEQRLATHRAEYGTARSIRVERHGELGPVLLPSRGRFTSR